MEYRYSCPNCGYESTTTERRSNPECPQCFSLLNEEISDAGSEMFDRISAALSGRADVRRISLLKNNSYLVEFSGTPEDMDSVRSALEPIGRDVYTRERDNRFFAILLDRAQTPSQKGITSHPLFYVGLLAATILSTVFAGYILSQPLVDDGLMGNVWTGALSFSFGLLAILGCHEMGHKIQSIRSGIDATWPYFIPMPFLPLGTLGALIRIKSAIPTRDDAVKLGVSGPIVGFLVSIPVILAGMRLSYVVPVGPVEQGGVYLGDSILFAVLRIAAVPNVPDGMGLWIHPLAFAGWVGLFITMLNLLPMGQLDGGHVTRAVLGDKGHRRLSGVLVKALIGVGLVGMLSDYGVIDAGGYVWSGWLIWGVIGHFVTKGGHPGPLDDISPLSRNAKVLSAIGLAVFVLCFIPVPIVVA